MSKLENTKIPLDERKDYSKVNLTTKRKHDTIPKVKQTKTKTNKKGDIMSNVIKNIQTIESLATIAAIGAGLWWFHKRREKAPRANVEHKVKFVDLKNGTVYVGVHVNIQNTGNVRIRPKVEKSPVSAVVIEELMPYLGAKLESQELSPEYKMEFLGSRTFPPKICIEPGENQSILFEFVIQSTTKSIKVYSHIDNSYNDGVGWDVTTIHEVKV